MIRYYCTNKRGQTTVESETTIVSTDDRVKNFFEHTPVGYRKAYTSEGLPFNELIPVPSAEELLQKAKDLKVAAIDTQTGLDIEALVGDNNKQKAKLAEATTLARLESKGIATVEQIVRLDELDSLNIQVEQLKVDGNTKEVLVQAATTIEEVEAI